MKTVLLFSLFTICLFSCRKAELVNQTGDVALTGARLQGNENKAIPVWISIGNGYRNHFSYFSSEPYYKEKGFYNYTSRETLTSSSTDTLTVISYIWHRDDPESEPSEGPTGQFKLLLNKSAVTYNTETLTYSGNGTWTYIPKSGTGIYKHLKEGSGTLTITEVHYIDGEDYGLLDYPNDVSTVLMTGTMRFKTN